MDRALSLSDLILKGFWEKFVESCEATGGEGEQERRQGLRVPHRQIWQAVEEFTSSFYTGPGAPYN